MARRRTLPHGAAVPTDFQGPIPQPAPAPTSAAPTYTPPAASQPNPTADWYKAYFSQYGLPGNVQQQIVSILTSYASDPATALALAQQYLRTTDWYQQTFPGISQGQSNGLFTDETGYRAYLNSVNQAYNQYLGRHVSGSELQGYIAAGYSPETVGRMLAGSAWAQANAKDVNLAAGAYGEAGELSQDQLATLGRQEAGIDTVQGQKLLAMVQRAQQRMQGVFQGVLARPSLSLGPTGVSAPGLAGNRQTPDVAA